MMTEPTIIHRAASSLCSFNPILGLLRRLELVFFLDQHGSIGTYLLAHIASMLKHSFSASLT